MNNGFALTLTLSPRRGNPPFPRRKNIVAALRHRCKRARLLVQSDSGFCTEEILAWCEQQPEVYYCVGLAQNSARVFAEFEYQTKKAEAARGA